MNGSPSSSASETRNSPFLSFMLIRSVARIFLSDSAGLLNFASWRARNPSSPPGSPARPQAAVRELVDPVEPLVQDRLDLGLHLRQLRALPEDALRGRRLGLVDRPAELAG